MSVLPERGCHIVVPVFELLGGKIKSLSFIVDPMMDIFTIVYLWPVSHDNSVLVVTVEPEVTMNVTRLHIPIAFFLIRLIEVKRYFQSVTGGGWLSVVLAVHHELDGDVLLRGRAAGSSTLLGVLAMRQGTVFHGLLLPEAEMVRSRIRIARHIRE